MASRKKSPGYRVTRVYPARGHLQRFLLDQPITLRCSKCQQTSMSSSVVTVSGDWGKLLCIRCYSHAKTDAPVTRETKPKPEPTAVPLRPQPVASSIPRDMAWLASLHRTVAEGGKLAPAEQKFLESGAGKPDSIAAIRYAELLVDSEARVADVCGDAQGARRLTAVRDILAQSCQAAALTFKNEYQRERTALDAEPVMSDPLEAAVVRAVTGDRYTAALTQALKRRSLRVHALERPTTDVWRWLDEHEGSRWRSLPSGVRRMCRLDSAAFTRKAFIDVYGAQRDPNLAHEAVAEQWVSCANEIVSALIRVRGSLESELRNAPPAAKAALKDRLQQSGEAYARGGARCLEARLILGHLQLRAVRKYRTQGMRNLRADCLAEATRTVIEADTVLSAIVTEACREHRVACPAADGVRPCADCPPQVADVVRERLSEAPPIDVPRQPAQRDLPQPSERKIAEQPSDGLFTCKELLKSFSDQKKLSLVVLECQTGPDDGTFGYAWLARDGSHGQGVGTALNELDQTVQALCTSALLIRETASSVRLVSRHLRAVNIVHLTLRSGAAYTPLDAQMSERTRESLRQVAERPHGIAVSIDPCEQRHQGSMRAEELARLAALGADGGADERPDEALPAAEVAPRALVPAATERLVGPDDEAGPARWLTVNGGQGVEMSWRVALHRVHLDNNWCPLPEGRMPDREEGRHLSLYLNHEPEDTSYEPVQRVALRQRGSQWELAGLTWPSGLVPGTLITFTWRLAEGFVTGETAPLAEPERIDGVYFTHEYDPHVVTRQNAPGTDQYDRVPDLTDTGWALHTLRKLGYLTEDGEAILAEDALVENCLRLGLPAHRAVDIPDAVRQLLRARTLDRVIGSQDSSGYPWYPPLARQPRVPLLRYRPRVEAVATGHAPAGEAPRRRSHDVAGFLRRLPPGAKASPEQEDAYREAIREARIVDRGLPDGLTYVRPHHRAR
ncbi:hypothetical protein ACQPZK_16420 [Micromonospora sp. CA-249363]|uniref:hypothetical protein n=1 Tax=Micromonospora sp. CA-249363 TaxID=3239963 RepID=UPI003D91E158